MHVQSLARHHVDDLGRDVVVGSWHLEIGGRASLKRDIVRG